MINYIYTCMSGDVHPLIVGKRCCWVSVRYLDWTLPQGSLKAVVYTVARLGAAELREHGQDSGERAGHARQTPPVQLGHVAAGRQVAPRVRTAWAELFSLHV